VDHDKVDEADDIADTMRFNSNDPINEAGTWRSAGPAFPETGR
jgi:hypothetical protein